MKTKIMDQASAGNEPRRGTCARALGLRLPDSLQEL